MEFYEGNYYLTTSQGDAIRMWKAPTLEGLKTVRAAEIWHDTNSSRSCNLWAPETHFVTNHWYVYYTASVCNDDDSHRMHVLESADTDPLGPYHYKGRLFDPANDHYAIDGTVFKNPGDGTWYFVWAARPGHVLTIARMANPWTLSGGGVIIPASGFGCSEVREGPQVLEHKGQLFLVYSACDTGKPDYKLGMLIADSHSDLLDPKSWVQFPRPVFERADANGVFGPGHNGFFHSPDGQEDWMVYHAKQTAEYTYAGRTTRAQKITWNPDGTPDFGVPLPLNALLEEPSDRRRMTATSPARVPVILDTDIGDDIDDTWALALLLKSPELDLKLAVGDYGRAQYRARLLAKLLARAGRSDVSVGVGLDAGPAGDGRQAAWLQDYGLKSYPGKVLTNGVQAIVDTIMCSLQPVTLICIGPAPNIAAALKREPRIAQHARFVGMDGSVRVGYGGAKQPCAEWNVKADPKALQVVFAAPWEITITPLDTCGLVVLTGDKYQRVREATDRNVSDLIANYRVWLAAGQAVANLADQRSSTLFDPVAVYLAQRRDLCVMEQLRLRVTEDGQTVVDPHGRQVNVATKWKDLGAFEDFMVDRLTGTR